MRRMDCPKNPLMACGREDCIKHGCCLIQPIMNEPWPPPIDEVGQRIVELEGRVTNLENRLWELEDRK